MSHLRMVERRSRLRGSWALWAAANTARRKLGAILCASYDVMAVADHVARRPSRGATTISASPASAPPNNVDELFAIPCQFTVPHNIMGTPAMSLPLAMHSTGVPIGVQIAARPADEHVLLQLAAALEQAMPWSSGTPPLHVSRM